jgi:hypothetical protein
VVEWLRVMPFNGPRFFAGWPHTLRTTGQMPNLPHSKSYTIWSQNVTANPNANPSATNVSSIHRQSAWKYRATHSARPCRKLAGKGATIYRQLVVGLPWLTVTNPTSSALHCRWAVAEV